MRDTTLTLSRWYGLQAGATTRNLAAAVSLTATMLTGCAQPRGIGIPGSKPVILDEQKPEKNEQKKHRIIGYSGRLITHGDKLYVYRMVIGMRKTGNGMLSASCLNMELSAMHDHQDGESLVSLKLLGPDRKAYEGAPQALAQALERLHVGKEQREKIERFLLTPANPDDSSYLEFPVDPQVKKSPCYINHSWLELAKVGNCDKTLAPVAAGNGAGRTARPDWRSFAAARPSRRDWLGY